MFGLGISELIVILVVALIFLGPDKLPEAAKSLGRTIGDLRRTLDDFKREVNLSEPPRERTTPTHLRTTSLPGENKEDKELTPIPHLGEHPELASTEKRAETAAEKSDSGENA